ncbi:hypothetical protein H5410_052650 [Solanum commersonii]|uniref:Uncharacterized protein n=1 Tax=Solanum commersonii TaxID=4109 RepID=A0A9J5X2S4_SOLCO|nr:hypothetical protein H5410_052650 [Solanum commersonii]
MLEQELQSNNTHNTRIALSKLKLNIFSITDDIILFSGDKRSLTLMMNTFSTYERVCVQQINKLKSSVSLSGNKHIKAITKIEEITRMEYKKLPIKYLGCPLYEGRKNTALFSEIMGKILKRIGGCHTKMLSVGGKAVLIKHVLLSLSVHMLVAIHPPVGVLNQIKKMLNIFFWGGRADFRRLQDICKAFTIKQWWNLKTKNSL